MKPEEFKLLELAAKACGITLDFNVVGDFPPYYINERGGHSSWNPLKDDGDALRLAVKLRIDFDMYGDSINCKRSSDFDDTDDLDWMQEYFEADEFAATRRAIVRAAAEIGEKHGL